MFYAIVLLFPLLLASAEPDRLTELVEEMRQLTHAGDHRAVGRLAPLLLQELAKPHPKAALAWNQAGVFFVTQGDYGEAERAYLRGIRLLEKEGTSTGGLELLNLNLASLYLETGQRPGHAEVLCRRALQQAIELYGPASPQLANFIYILGASRQQQGDLKDARRYFQQALGLAGNSRDGKLRQSIVLGNLGVLLAQDKEWLQAKDALLQSIALMEPLFGPSHPDLARTHLNLARVYEHLKQWTSAYASLARVREITESRLSPEHPLMAEILSSSASILRKTGHRREARNLDRRAKAIAAAQPKNSVSQSGVHIADLMLSGRH